MADDLAWTAIAKLAAADHPRNVEIRAFQKYERL
jgi:hypothetical protein